MRIGVDARTITFPGIGRYIRNLLHGLQSHRGSHEVLVYLPPGIPDSFPGLTTRVVSVPPLSIQEQYIMPRYVAEDRLDVLHVPQYAVPAMVPCRVVVTLHDMVYLRYPPRGLLRMPHRIYYAFMQRLAVARASAVIANSSFGRSEVCRYLGVPDHRITVVPIGVAPHMRPRDSAACAAARERYRLPDSFVLYVGTNKPWKNVETLLRAFQLALREQPDMSLVLAGMRGKNEEPLEHLLTQLNIREGVHLIGTVEEADMPSLYSSARVTVSPSLYEGFGLTPLEAMACGCPVISSKAASLPEVVGDAAMLVDPLDVEGWATAITRLWTDDMLRCQLSAAGLVQASRFSIEGMAERTMEVYLRTLSEE